MKTTEFVRSATFRITMSCTLAFIGTLLALSAAFDFGGAKVWHAEIEETIADEQRKLLVVYESGGVDGLAAAVGERAIPVSEQGFIYLLQGADGTKLAGQLPAMVTFEGVRDFVPPWGEDDEPFVALGTTLPDKSFLLVGHDAHDLHDATELVEEGTVWILSIAVPLSLLTALVSSALIVRRLETINRLSLEIRSGHLDRRIPVSGKSDEFDRLASHLNAMLDGIQDLTESLRQMSNNIAHELRTPLTRIHNKVEAARRQPLSTEEVKAILDSTVLELNGLLNAFAALLRIAYIDAGTLRSSFKEFALSETLSALAEDFDPILREDGKRLSAKIEPNLRCFGDKRLIVQMVVNLLENAIAHSGSDEISLSAQAVGKSIEVHVTDRGVGIPEAERKRVFQRFYRLKADGPSAGFGLGLSLVAAIAKLHRIEIVLSDNQPGLKVVLHFPPARTGLVAE